MALGKTNSPVRYRPKGGYRIVSIFADCCKDYPGAEPCKTFEEARKQLAILMFGTPQIVAGLIFSETTHIVLKRRHVLG